MSGVRPLPLEQWSCSSIGRARPCQGRGSGIETRQDRHAFVVKRMITGVYGTPVAGSSPAKRTSRPTTRMIAADSPHEEGIPRGMWEATCRRSITGLRLFGRQDAGVRLPAVAPCRYGQMEMTLVS